MNFWDQIKQLLSKKISSEAYQNWLSRTAFHRCEGAVLWVSVPDEVTKQWMQQEYAGEVWAAIRDLELPLQQVVYDIAKVIPASTATNEHGEVVFAPSINLNPRD